MFFSLKCLRLYRYVNDIRKYSVCLYNTVSVHYILIDEGEQTCEINSFIKSTMIVILPVVI